jgi:integrase
MPLTSIAVRNSKPASKPRKLFDERGLFLLIQPNGAKYWRWKYRYAGKEKKLALGIYPQVSLADARQRCDEARRLLDQGTDPGSVVSKAARRRVQRQAVENSFEPIAREWLENIRARWTPLHYKDTLARFQTHVFSEIGALSIKEVAPPLLLAMLRKVEATGANETARKIARACSQIFRYAIASGRCERDAAADIRGALKPKAPVQHVAAISSKELPDLLRKIDAYTDDGDGELQTKLALQLMVLTFVRTTELRAAAWDEFDIAGALWRIPAERMKTGIAHTVPLSTQALDVLAKLRALNAGYSFVFPGRTPSKPMSKNTILFALYRMGFRGRMTGHGFRAVASTMLNEMGFDADAVERQLAHVQKNKVRAAYHRSEYLPERKAMMQHWANVLDQLRSDSAKVTPIRARSR